jgi:uncharacterized protein
MSNAKGERVVNSPKGDLDQPNSNASSALGVLNDAKYLNLETFRQYGEGVRTPVWFAAGPKNFSGSGVSKFYVYTTADSGKAKRIRRSGALRTAACDIRGKLTGPWTDAVAAVVTGKEFELGMRFLDRKYFPWKQLLNLSAMLFRRRERTMLAIRPILTETSADRIAVGR